MIENHEVSVHEVETVQFVTGLLCVQDILVDDESRTLCSVGCASANLTNRTELAKEVEECRSVDVVCEILDKQNAIRFRGQFVASGHVLARMEVEGRVVVEGKK